MGALKGTVTVRRYLLRGEQPRDTARMLKGLRAHAHMPIDPRSDVTRAYGWASVNDLDDTDLDADKVFLGDTLTVTLRVESLKPPAAAVRKLVAEGIRALGRKPSKDEKDALKLQAIRKLRAQILPVNRGHDMVWLLDAGRVLFWSHAKKANELLTDLFHKSFGLELLPDGPGEVARPLLPATLPVLPTPEMFHGFPGLPGRPVAAEDSDA